LLASLACLATLATAPAAPVPKHLLPKEPSFTFPTRVGTKWVYECYSIEVTIVISEVKEQSDGSKLVTTEFVCGEERTPHQVMRVSAAGVFLLADGAEQYDEPWLIWQLPHREGQSWTTNNGPMTAGPVEKVKVGAGEFSAARVEWNFTGGPGKVTKWYANNVGLVKMDENMVLKSFTPGKD
jgi:hypothetical protein